jgi:hypothetical protein
MIKDLPTQRTETLEPNPDGMTDVFSRIGYSLGDALADIIDNSIDAGAKNVVIQIHRTKSQISRITIADDGCGMSPGQLARIMQFGVRSEDRPSRLGKYGIGLKTASFSQCSAFTVVTRAKGAVSARRWSYELAKRGWKIEVIDDSAATNYWKRDWTPIVANASTGTIVVWDNLQRLVPDADGFEGAVAKLRAGLRIELGLKFHRFIESGRLRLTIREQSESGLGLPEPVTALDPFGYGGRAGRKGYPITFNIRMEGDISLKAEAHIWPAKSKSPNYKLGSGTVVKRQGFYFYRNDRLIEAGGWHGYKSQEPHLSLARVRIDLPTELDAAFQLTVQKTGCSPPPEFLTVLRTAKVGDTTFSTYLDAAQDAYRNAPAPVSEIAVPGRGMPKEVAAALRKMIKSQNKGAPQRKISFEWKRLSPIKVIEIDLGASRVLLNSSYKTRLWGRQASARAIAPFLALLFINLRDFLAYERTGKRVQQREDELNEVLIKLADPRL